MLQSGALQLAERPKPGGDPPNQPNQSASSGLKLTREDLHFISYNRHYRHHSFDKIANALPFAHQIASITPMEDGMLRFRLAQDVAPRRFEPEYLEAQWKKVEDPAHEDHDIHRYWLAYHAGKGKIEEPFPTIGVKHWLELEVKYLVGICIHEGWAEEGHLDLERWTVAS
ncbi:MAG: hypothetical protein Q9211_001863 [Gyalolechia sp. 1 TL-2023]